MCLVDTFSKYVHMIYVCIYILYTLIGKLILQKILETTHPPLPSAINPCVFVSVESKVPRPTCHPNQLPAIHRFSFPHRWSTLPLHQGPGEKKQGGFFNFWVIGPEEQNWRQSHEGFFTNARKVFNLLSEINRSRFPYMKKRVTNEPLTEAFF